MCYFEWIPNRFKVMKISNVSNAVPLSILFVHVYQLKGDLFHSLCWAVHHFKMPEYQHPYHLNNQHSSGWDSRNYSRTDNNPAFILIIVKLGVKEAGACAQWIRSEKIMRIDDESLDCTAMLIKRHESNSLPTLDSFTVHSPWHGLLVPILIGAVLLLFWRSEWRHINFCHVMCIWYGKSDRSLWNTVPINESRLAELQCSHWDIKQRHKQIRDAKFGKNINRFEIKSESEDQGQSNPKSTGTRTVLRCIFGPNPNLEILTSIGGDLSREQANNLQMGWIWTFMFNLTLKIKVDRATKNSGLNQVVLHLCSKFGDPSLNGYRVISQTSKWLTHRLTRTQTQTQITAIPAGQNWSRVIKHYKWDQS